MKKPNFAAMNDPANGKKPRTYRKRARKDYLKYTRCRKHTAKMTRKAIGKQLGYLRRDLNLLSHSNSFGFEMEKDAAGCRALNRNYYCRRH